MLTVYQTNKGSVYVNNWNKTQMRTLLTFTLLLASVANILAQDPADIFHRTVDVDQVNQISFDVYADDQVEFRTWPGDDLLIETSVEIKNVKQDILDFYMRQNRYLLKPLVEGDQMQVVSFDTSRLQVKGTEGLAQEEVQIVVYMPESFSQTDEGLYARNTK